MSKERFTWLKEIGSEVIATPGTESNVKEIYDKCWELKQNPLNIVFNQFEEFGNPIWHYNVTGPALDDALRTLLLRMEMLLPSYQPPVLPELSLPATT